MPNTKPEKHIEFRKLLGFAALSDEMGDTVDFQADAVGAKLGAKVGVEDRGTCEIAQESGDG